MRSAGQKFLIVNADDFGFNSSVNQAVLDGYLNGCLTSASMMAVVPPEPFDEAIGMLKSHRDLDFGLQIVLTSDVLCDFKPLSEGAGISRGGFFYKNPLRWAYVLSQKKLGPQLKTEMRQQIEKILGTGLVPSHLNSHYYATELPGVCEILLDLAKEYGIKAVRNPYESEPSGRYFVGQAIRILARRNRPKILKEGLMTTDYYYGVSYSGRMNKDRFLDILRRLKPGVTELLLHPALENSSHFHEREEYEALISNEVEKSLEGSNIALTCYRDLQRFA